MNTKTISRLRNGQITKAGATPGFYARKRGDRIVWLLRYAIDKTQRELIFGCLNDNGVMGQLAGAVALEAMGRTVDFEAALLASKGAREPIPPQHAELIARKLRSMIEAGRDLVVELRQRRSEAETEARERGDRSVEAVAERWVKHLKRQGKRSADEVGNVLKRHVHPRISSKDIGKVGRADAHRIYDALAEEGKATTGAHAVRLLRALMSYATDRSLVPANPLLRIKIEAAKPRARVLVKFHPEREPDATELRAIWAAADTLKPAVRAACIKVLILTAQRRGEVQRMRWGEVDGSLWTIPPERHKGGRGHEVPLSTQVLAILNTLAEDRRPDRFVFEGRGHRPLGDFSEIKAKLDAESGVRDWVLHDARRSAAAWLREAGFSRDDVEDVLGHSMPTLVSTYQSGPRFARKRAALQAWADFVEAVAACGDRKVVPMRA